MEAPEENLSSGRAQGTLLGTNPYLLDLPPAPQHAIVTNEGLGWDSLLKMV